MEVKKIPENFREIYRLVTYYFICPELWYLFHMILVLFRCEATRVTQPRLKGHESHHGKPAKNPPNNELVLTSSWYCRVVLSTWKNMKNHGVCVGVCVCVCHATSLISLCINDGYFPSL